MKQLLPFVLLAIACFLASCENTHGTYTNDLIKSPDTVHVSYTTSGLDSFPIFKRGRIPTHPDSQRWETGYAKISFTINERGKTENFKVIDSRGQYFAGNTIQAIRYWKFDPAQKDGTAVSCNAVYEIHFRGLHFGGVNE